MNKYAFTPSLMAMYSYYLTIEDEADRKAKEQEIIDYINRVEKPEPHLAARGTAFNNIIDALLEGHPVEMTEDKRAYRVYYHGETYLFGSTTLIDNLTDYFLGSHGRIGYKCEPQVYCETDIKVDGNDVKLYGYADYVNIDFVFDLKTTMKYSLWKYRSGWQHLVYPLALINSWQVDDIIEFKYIVATMSEKISVTPFGETINDSTITAIDIESYPFKYDQALNEVSDFLSSGLIPFVEDHRDVITRRKIFQEE